MKKKLLFSKEWLKKHYDGFTFLNIPGKFFPFKYAHFIKNKKNVKMNFICYWNLYNKPVVFEINLGDVDISKANFADEFLRFSKEYNIKLNGKINLRRFMNADDTFNLNKFYNFIKKEVI